MWCYFMTYVVIRTGKLPDFWAWPSAQSNRICQRPTSVYEACFGVHQAGQGSKQRGANEGCLSLMACLSGSGQDPPSYGYKLKQKDCFAHRRCERPPNLGLLVNFFISRTLRQG